MSDARVRRRKAALALVAVLAVGVGALALWLRSRPGDATPSAGHGGGGGTAQAPTALREGEGGALASNPRTPAPPGMDAPAMLVEPPSAPATDPSTWKDIRFALVDAVTGLPLPGDAVEGPTRLLLGGEFPLPRVGPALAQLRVGAGPGYVAWEPTSYRFAPDLVTAGVSLVYPLHRAIDLELAVVDAEQRPADGAQVIAVGVDGRPFGGKVDALGAGRFRVHDLPFVPKGRVAVELTWAPEGATEADVVDADSVMRGDAAWTGRMPDQHGARFKAIATLRGGRIQEVQSESPFAELDDDVFDVPPSHASIHVRARRRDGQPAANAHVVIHPGHRYGLGAAGDIALDWSVGACTVSLVDPRLVPTTAQVEIREGETTEVELVEPDPAMLEVTVVDAAGKPVPVARVEVVTPSGMPALDLVDGILRIDPYADELGRRTFTWVEPGAVTVRAWGRGGTGETQVTLRPGLRSAVTVVVK